MQQWTVTAYHMQHGRHTMVMYGSEGSVAARVAAMNRTDNRGWQYGYIYSGRIAQ